MQLILVSNRSGAAKSVTLSARQLTFGAASAALSLLFAAAALTFFALQHSADSGNAAMRELLLSWSGGALRAPGAAQSARLDAMARKIGHLQARTTVLDLQGESVAALVGIGPQEFRLDGLPGLGGLAPAASNGTLSMDRLEHVLERLAAQIGNHADSMDALESRVLDYAGRQQLLPTLLPVENAQIGSGFGMRTDPFDGLPAMHEGLDFTAEVGTPIRAAGGGIVIFAGFHHEFGNLVVIDHGNGIVTRYGHCSRLDVKQGDVVMRGEVIGAVGETGHATGPHLHFEVRYNGVAQNPNKYLRADLRRLRQAARTPGASAG